MVNNKLIKGKKVLIINSGAPPFPGSNGCSVQLYSIIKSFTECGLYVKLVNINTYFANFEEEKFEKSMLALGVESEIIEQTEKFSRSLFSNIIKPKVEKFYSGIFYRTRINKIIEKWQPEYIYCYTLNAALSYDYELINIPNGISIVDIDSLVYKYRNYYSRIGKPFRTKIRKKLEFLTYRDLDKVLLNRLEKANVVFEHAYHHKEWLRKKGIQNVHYFPVNVFNDSTINQNLDLKYDNFKELKISLLGNVYGIATLSGLFSFFQELLPQLEKKAWSKNIKFDIVGGGELVLPLRKLLNSTSIRIEMQGYIDSLDEVYNQSHAILVPTPIELGFRTRIVEAFSMSSCVITHIANANAMPEFVNGKNGMIYNTPKEFVEISEQFYLFPEKMKILAINAYDTFKNELDGATIGKKMVNLLLTSNTRK